MWDGGRTVCLDTTLGRVNLCLVLDLPEVRVDELCDGRCDWQVLVCFVPERAIGLRGLRDRLLEIGNLVSAPTLG